ncbi:OmpH family outer membrane protein [Mariniflexile litorale]|uniref:OmpH family outer membrane protein n=1 Tax=Mariniflexile litorale TaxID=3045158 RepID=A0AAU7EIN8_9FLAO|nr:OmpH family outer membrane protein [Mariniflexile sp. KMM 9835]MDQ8213266.1 OmpH family outer membrane protein [Mariniflexile sp. KMM 9835]
MNKLNIHATINSILLLTLVVFGFYFYLDRNKQEIVYIDNIKLFNGFNMTKDIKSIEEAKINKQGKELDSLYAIFQSVTNKEAVAFKNLQQQIAYKSKAIQELQDNYTHQLSNTIWDRLNSYIKEYAQTKKFKIIVGTSGNGNVMYGDETTDITTQILKFSNIKYEGNN